MEMGFIITCFRGREREALNEALITFNTITIRSHVNTSINFNERIHSEIDNNEKLFDHSHIKKLKNIVFIKNKSSCDSVKIYEEIVKRKLSCRFIQRLIPLDFIGNLKFWKDVISLMVEKSKSFDVKTYKILYEKRLSEKGLKDEIFDTVTRNMILKVDLCNPDLLMVVQVFKTHIGGAVILNDSINFNIQKNNKI
ncbi:hypothetical protein EDEG_00508 [Edhazardia aedis USNM 41457]|uniref:Uncharacterized protein n=1 Tax=Edhazardia aedis (strain USNM 41457) TaxID=1003232 RepID=J9D094_EDHAE|nr:hypothetical protein EDEG_00508 [Edhazardia aedis USNM 41457]|eukprot:EJW01291.2 hypothetical protein EDEG_00508 [Edhazardia aedis USNM 41457]